MFWCVHTTPQGFCKGADALSVFNCSYLSFLQELLKRAKPSATSIHYRLQVSRLKNPWMQDFQLYQLKQGLANKPSFHNYTMVCADYFTLYLFSSIPYSYVELSLIHSVSRLPLLHVHQAQLCCHIIRFLAIFLHLPLPIFEAHLGQLLLHADLPQVLTAFLHLRFHHLPLGRLRGHAAQQAGVLEQRPHPAAE